MLRILTIVIVSFHISWAYLAQMNDIQTNDYALQNSSHEIPESEFLYVPQFRSNRHRRNANPNGTDEKPCPRMKPIIKKAFTRCSTATNECIVQCSTNHQFANGKTSVKLLCKAGVWTLEGFEKSDRPACEPNCNPPCKNGGVCKAPGKCTCPEMFDGSQCEKMKSNCPTMPESQASQMVCDGNMCTISCIEGHALPDGLTEMQMICEADKWVPAKKEQQSFEPNCEPLCENGRIYKECSQMVEQSCEGMAETEAATNSSFECNQGCFCPQGTVDHEGDCIPAEQCPKMPNTSSQNLKPSSNGPEMKSKDGNIGLNGNGMPSKMDQCMLEGQSYEDGDEVQKECGSCKCEQGKWSCTNDGCAGRCEVYGDPHYKTFDGLRYDFMGKSSFYLMRIDSGLDIMAENGDCPPIFSKEVACTRSVTVMDQNGPKHMQIQLKQGGRVLFGDVEAPIYGPTLARLRSGAVLINRIGPTDVQLLFRNGMQLIWDGFTYAYIDAPSTVHNRTSGLCGNFDSIAENDMQTPSGEMAMSPDQFANEWRVKENPQNENENNGKNKTDAAAVPHPCQVNRSNVQRATNVCAILKSNLFQECDIDPEPYYKDCMYDMCACQGDRAACICTIFSAYGNECSRKMMPVQWRERFPECRK